MGAATGLGAGFGRCESDLLEVLLAGLVMAFVFGWLGVAVLTAGAGAGVRAGFRAGAGAAATFALGGATSALIGDFAGGLADGFAGSFAGGWVEAFCAGWAVAFASTFAPALTLGAATGLAADLTGTFAGALTGVLLLVFATALGAAFLATGLLTGGSLPRDSRIAGAAPEALHSPGGTSFQQSGAALCQPGGRQSARIVSTRWHSEQRAWPDHQARHCSKPCKKMSLGKSMPIKTILLIFSSPATHLGPRSLPIN